MKIKNVTERDIKNALKETNEKFGNNIIFNRFDVDHLNRSAEVTLKVKDILS